MATTGVTSAPARRPDERPTKQVLTFKLGATTFAVDVLKVQEIRSYLPPTPLPHTPPHVKGVVNIRGAVIPIVDLRTQLMPAADTAEGTAIIVVNGGTGTTGCLVDAVCDVVELDAADVTQPVLPDEAARAGVIDSMATCAGELVIVLDVEQLTAGRATPPAGTSMAPGR